VRTTHTAGGLAYLAAWQDTSGTATAGALILEGAHGRRQSRSSVREHDAGGRIENQAGSPMLVIEIKHAHE
jgi:hypothetical protein